MYEDSGGALVLLLIVRNFQFRTRNEISAKFAMLLFLSFGKYECNLVSDLSHSDLVIAVSEVTKTSSLNSLVSLNVKTRMLISLT